MAQIGTCGRGRSVMRNILVVVGTRPEAIKMAPLVRRLQALPEFATTVCSTGQHREMIHQVFRLFSIEPDIDLDVMQPGQTLSDLTGRVVSGMDALIREMSPDRVLVHGDTTTTFAATLAAYYNKVPVGHVEAGLRTGNIYAPWPEEINRKLTDAIADRLYAPTIGARDNLLREGAKPEHILITGNTVIDALLDVRNGPLQDAATQRDLRERFTFIDRDKKLILVTCHRRESFGQGFRDICAALATLADRKDVQIVFPVHLNPNVRAVFRQLHGHPHVALIEPLDYLEFVFMLSLCHCILTDSGGIQEEAPSLGKPVLVMRQVTERPEAVAAGTVKLVGSDTDVIVRTAIEILDNPSVHSSMSSIHNPYGDGRACERIIASLIEETA
jgi:UDP-N-acetylglucosamine 2-epimerase (non-hydrolysing)